MSEERVEFTIDAHVAHVRLNRPEKRNGLDPAMFQALLAAGTRILGDPTVRAVVLSGAGKAFCAGLDWPAFLAMGAEAAEHLAARDSQSPANVAQRACWIWQEIPVPVIAAVHGAAFGGGLQLALGADLRIAAPDAKLSVMEIRYGLIPDMTATQTLVRLVRPDVARELLFTGRVVSGDEAVSIGLATRVSATPLLDALEMARGVAAQSPHAIRAAKRLLSANSHREAPASFKLETDLQMGLLGTPNQMEAVRSVLERRPPVFDDVEP